MAKSDDFDFGFSIVDENELPQVQVLQQTQEVSLALEDKLQQLYDSIMPLLKNLKTNPDKDYILWPNRTAKIDAFKQKIDSIVGDAVEYRDI